MDGSGGAEWIVPNVMADLITVDHSSRLLFWTVREDPPGTGSFSGIYFSDINGQSVRLAIGLKMFPSMIQVAGNRLYWVTTDDKVLRSCEKVTGNNLITHELHNWDGSVKRLLVISGGSDIQTGRFPCSEEALCSHICVPTPTGYMRCFCPHGYQLLPDGWTCGEHLPTLQ